MFNQKNTGYRNTGDRNTGNWNTGNWNSGNWNTGYRNTGYRNTGNWNTGNWNTGNWNSGNWNTGYRNTGDWNTGDRNTGFFNTTSPTQVQVFDGEFVNRKDFLNQVPSWFYIPENTTWVCDVDMTDQEKTDNPSFHTCCGYLRVNDWFEEWKRAYNMASPEDIQKARDLSGFNANVFQKITGLDLSEKPIETVSDNPKEIFISGARYILAE